MKKNKISKVLMDNGYGMKAKDSWMKTIEGGRIYVRTEDLNSFLGDISVIISKEGYEEDGKLKTKIVLNALHLDMILKREEKKSKIKASDGNIQTVLIDKGYSLINSDDNGAEYYKYEYCLDDEIKTNVEIKKDIIKIEGRIIGYSVNFDTVYKGSDFEEFRNVLKEFEKKLEGYVVENFEEGNEYDD